MRVFIVVPVFNEGKVFERWLPGLLKVAGEMEGKDPKELKDSKEPKDIVRVVVVDDGSSWQLADGSRQQGRFLANCQLPTVIFLRHEVNCGVGAAVATGMEYARRQGADFVMTIDGDGQHCPGDLLAIYEELRNGYEEQQLKNERMKKEALSEKPENQRTSRPADQLTSRPADIVNGSRFLKRQKIPFLRRVANFLANIITFLLSGFWVSDSQSGMKGFSRNGLEKIVLQSPGYEWCTDVFREANWNKLSVKEVPISVKYNLYTLNKGQSFALGLDLIVRLMVRSLVR